MSGKDKNDNDQISGYLRYRGNKMTEKERNAFERNLQKDPFAEEASEGFERVDPSVAKNDLLNLEKSLRKRTSQKTRVIWYTIAASVVVLMIISSIFIIVNRNRPSDQISYSPTAPSLKETTDLQDQKKATAKDEKREPVTAIPDMTRKEKDVEQKSEGKSEKQSEIKKSEVVTEQHEAFMVAEAAEPERIITNEKAMAAEPVRARKSAATYSQIKGRVISSEDNQPIPGVSIIVKGTNKGTVTDTGGNFTLGAEEARNKVLVADFIGMASKEFKAVEDSSIEIKLDPSVAALSEIVVVGYGAKNRDSEPEDALTGYSPPTPVKGKADFDRYIRDNLRRPDTTTTGQRVVVVLSFRVDVDGKVDSIKIIRSPGSFFSDEAIRLIKDGPAWKPAEENGRKIKDDVRIRIVFK